ncbi:outer membrane protein [Aliidiomarina soli]|nr:outer membrane beta-barrel protein [Aliidiomarina soli]
MKKAYLAALLASVISAPSLAQSPSFNYVEVSYFDADGLDGISAALVKELSDDFVMLADFAYASDSFMDTDIDVTSVSGGVGYRHAISEKTVLVAGPQLLYARAKVSANIGGQSFSDSDSETGFGILGLVRHMVSEQFELNGGLQYSNIGDGSNTDAFVGARLHLNEQFSLSASLAFDDADTVSVGVAYHF